MLRNLLTRLDRGLTRFEDWSLVAVVLVALFTGLINIILRKTTSISLYWSDEVVRKAVFFCTYVGCSAAVRQRSLIRIDALPQILPVTRRFFNLVNHLAVLLFSGLLTWLGLGLTRAVYADSFARTATLQLPEWWFYAVLPLVGLTMTLRTLILLVEDLLPQPVKEEAADGNQ
ncbi:TRAP transporter small permease [Desulfuromonas thiophila]|jgi:TRAP-type C4-dicarboxylate transport system permease small subunit|uniref:TRAP-type C4-dicarboxylate transport system, small permease component n=1 Tax=Desulfuromonas thiophila TaxID=57664 RepID=A0A1G7EHL9_9BACT|nr:TRAP transporter small permease [Desulfuromonas thiophila]MCK9173621.1 TRAP transporter small permease [Desulfuromonas thiophila]MDD3802618.1 TRAP transporter small permease [Desulfuromonas thiophila]MDY0398391.1 TRAP transporter small permease [Desulfuromonas thiophila]SDE62926.1 TRAP-type C4-dicarboxylate transport system, small permease component [Desulfuromonas thiophila]